MKKALKIILFVFLSIIVLISGFMVYAFSVSNSVKLDESKLINLEYTTSIYDKDGEVYLEQANSKEIVTSKDIPAHVKNAFVAIEDKRFYTHNGVDYKGLFRATIKNITSFSLKEGASTITQQLIKNTHLSGKKTLKRKIQEIALAKKLEKKFSKDQILTSYLNTIYFGDGCFGISNASNRYFSKKVSDLTINEGAILAGLIKAPSTYSPTQNEEKCFNRKNVVLSCMYNQGFISNEEYLKNKEKPINLIINTEVKLKNYSYLVNNEIDKIILPQTRYQGKLKVFTYLDTTLQNNLEKELTKYDLGTDKSAIILNSNSNILAYSSTVGEIKRQVGSVIKPLLVYGPAIETDAVCELTPILDEKTDFNGYSPSNYGDKYYGYVSVKDSLAKSLNVPAVKLLNTVGVKKAVSYLNKTAIKVNSTDENLSLALGSTSNGSTLLDVSSSYSVFQNDGNYIKAKCISKIIDEKGKIIYKDKDEKTKVFSNETTFILNDMLHETVTSGTAKKLSLLPFTTYAKTGTVGNDLGNTDAYSISYNKDYILGVWLGNKDNSLMDNSITGGSFPTKIAYDVWNKLYINSIPPEKFSSNTVKEYLIDKISYDEDHKILLADKNTPKRYVLSGLFKSTDKINKSSKIFSRPIIENVELSVNYNRIIMQLCVKEYYDARVYKLINGKRKLIYDTNTNGEKTFTDYDVLENNYYEYVVVPYYEIDGKEFLGEEYFINKIKTPTKFVGDDWWNIEFD